MKGLLRMYAAFAMVALLLAAPAVAEAVQQSDTPCPPGETPGPSGCAKPMDSVEVIGKGGGVGEWPGHLFIDTGGSYYTIRDGNDGGGDRFIGNSGTAADGQDASQKNPCKGNPIIFATGNKIEPETDFVTAGDVPLS